MLKIENGQLTLWDALLPEPMRKLPEELVKIDELLDDPALCSPSRKLTPPAVADRRFQLKLICA